MPRRHQVGRTFYTSRRGKVRVLEDEKGRQWLTCTGCRLDRFAPGVSSAFFRARDHAAECDR
ncbi:hypothetical protein ACIBCM_27755 [Streptomyces sp. NPDC051018]|uniref:hypothetical protein n=1 Tax=Streptomyces sp. NPDC051018 TaxID=3365639 RepID=UPI00378969C6